MYIVYTSKYIIYFFTVLLIKQSQDYFEIAELIFKSVTNNCALHTTTL